VLLEILQEQLGEMKFLEMMPEMCAQIKTKASLNSLKVKGENHESWLESFLMFLIIC